MKWSQLRLALPETRVGGGKRKIAASDCARGTPSKSHSGRLKDSELHRPGRLSSQSFIPVFIRLTNGPGTELWPGFRLTFRQVARLVSPGEWNEGVPPIRAYALRKQGKDRGITLIETSDIVKWLNKAFHIAGSSLPLIPEPAIALPPILHIPPSGGSCPHTGLRHTILVELVDSRSPYGHTRIKTALDVLPGNIKGSKMIATESLLRFIRSLPAPQYKIAPNPYAESS
jgi:hypothetical protein